ncbi:MAG: membrane protein insertion efficiency factor YidD [Gammaproteobacteria bacterium]|nr:membrane protein insertion efficiency factor YidD [Gammaproteobacteria bacterium]
MLSKTLRSLVIIYRWTIGLLLMPRCRFYPSCSQYALDALKRYAPPYAIWLIVKRLLKCQPWHAGGIDEVPPRKS